MKTNHIALTLLCLTSLFSCKPSDTKILNDTISKLNSLKTIEYDWSSKFISEDGAAFNREINYKIYFDFSSKDTIINTKFIFKTKTGEAMFDGQKVYLKENGLECVMLIDTPDKDFVYSTAGMEQSIYELKNNLPKLLSDPTIKHFREKDTIINKTDCYKFNFVIPNKYLSVDFINIDESIKNYIGSYTIAISKNNYLPTFIKRRSSNSGEYEYSIINNIKIDTNRTNDFNPKIFKKDFPIVKMADIDKFLETKLEKETGKKAIPFELKNINGKLVSLSDFKDKIVLLEFWFPKCFGCVTATPILNQIQEKYKKEGLVILGIEYTKISNKKIRKYIKEQNIKITTLIGGDKIAKKYNVQGAPMFYLLNKEKEIVYSSMAIYPNELVGEIEKLLNNK